MFPLITSAFKEKQKKHLHRVEPVQVYVLEKLVDNEVLGYLRGFVNLNSDSLKILETSTRFNIQLIEEEQVQYIVNLKKVNDIRFLNKFFETVNSKLYNKGRFVGCVETYEERASRIFKKFPNKFLAYPYYSLDFIVKRILPKFGITKKLYFIITQGHNRVLSKAETLGRLVSCGFKIIDYKEINNLLYFTAEKIRQPYFPQNPSYGPIFKMKRVGKDGKVIFVYKMRTMHPYAEYLQEYVYDSSALKEGGKFSNDFRITNWGKLFRKLWVDELPMLINFLKGDLKLVGVRPLSFHYLGLYTPEMRARRIKYKPGLVSPYYADLPKTIDEIMLSEQNYLNQCEKHPLLTDWRYFWKAFNNIAFKKARSS